MLKSYDIDLIKLKNILRKYSKIVRNFYKTLRFLNKHTLLPMIITDEDNNNNANELMTGKL